MPVTSHVSRTHSVLQIHRRKSCDLRKSPLYERCLTFIHSHKKVYFCRYAQAQYNQLIHFAIELPGFGEPPVQLVEGHKMGRGTR